MEPPRRYLIGALVFVAALMGFTPTAAQRPRGEGQRFATMLELQVLLDRAHFSPGEIDGRGGQNTDRALSAYTRARELSADPTDERVRETLGAGSVPVTVPYTITAADTAGPFADAIPTDLIAQATLSALLYTSPLELLGERFHAAPALLRRLNPEAHFTEGETIVVPNVAVAPLAASGSVAITVARSAGTLTVTDGSDQVIFAAPVSSGSEYDPLPIGDWTVKGVSHNPSFKYNPALFWDADAQNPKATIPPGPNNPVGIVWIDISKDHYGIHGTPEPAKVGHTQSHGCVRLTNWDAAAVAALVRPGTAVHFIE